MSVTPPKPKDVLTTAAARVSRAAPNAWEEFMAAFATYTRSRETACIQAPADGVLLAQGGARQCIELLDLLEAAKLKTGV